MGAIGVIGAQADPRQVRGEVEIAGAARHGARLGLLIAKVQSFVRGEELDAVAFTGAHAEHVLHEAEGFADGFDHAVIFEAVRRIAHPIEVEILGMMQVGESTLDQRANEVEREGGAFIAAEQELRVGRSRLRRELGAVDDIAAVTGKLYAVAGFGIGRAGFGVLTGKPADANHGATAADHQDQAHLHQHLEHVGDAARRAIGEALGAIAALQDEALAIGGFGELGAEL